MKGGSRLLSRSSSSLLSRLLPRLLSHFLSCLLVSSQVILFFTTLTPSTSKIFNVRRLVNSVLSPSHRPFYPPSCTSCVKTRHNFHKQREVTANRPAFSVALIDTGAFPAHPDHLPNASDRPRSHHHKGPPPASPLLKRLNVTERPLDLPAQDIAMQGPFAKPHARRLSLQRLGSGLGLGRGLERNGEHSCQCSRGQLCGFHRYAYGNIRNRNRERADCWRL